MANARRTERQPHHRTDPHPRLDRRPHPHRGRASLPPTPRCRGAGSPPPARRNDPNRRRGHRLAPPEARAPRRPALIPRGLRVNAAHPHLTAVRRQRRQRRHDRGGRGARDRDAQRRPRAKDGPQRPDVPALSLRGGTRSWPDPREPLHPWRRPDEQPWPLPDPVALNQRRHRHHRTCSARCCASSSSPPR